MVFIRKEYYKHIAYKNGKKIIDNWLQKNMTNKMIKIKGKVKGKKINKTKRFKK